MTFPFTNLRARTALGGFGLVELLVSISIMVLVTTVVLARHSGFNSAILLRSQAYEVALQIREVQLSAVSASDQAGSQVGNFRRLYGIKLASGNTDGTRYQVFSVDSTSGDWEDSISQVGVPGILDDRFQISCVQRAGPTGACTTGTHYVVFNRPNFDALFFDANGNSLALSSLIINVGPRGITEQRRGGGTKTTDRQIIITAAGQITVQ